MSAKIVDIVTEVPAYRYEQEEISAYMQHLFAAAPNIARQINVLYKKSAIDFRHSILPDFEPNAKVQLFKGKPLLSERLAIYKKAALALATSVAQKCIANHLKAEELTHIITVSCTGLHAPGLEIQLIKTLNLSPTIGRHPINFVGCYASIPALNLARMICANDSNAKILIVSVELCTLHFNEEPTRDNLMANALFADGAAACLVVGKNVDLKPIATIGSHFSQINSTGENEMAWTPS